MSVATSLISTFQGILAAHGGKKVVQRAHRLEAIREAMLDRLADEMGPGFSPLERSVLLAPDLQTLWYLRPELLMVIGAARGETAARATVGQISAMFDGMLPQGLCSGRSRPAR